MSSSVKNKKVRMGKKAGAATTSTAVGNYEKHPFFVKKAREMKTILDKTGLPGK